MAEIIGREEAVVIEPVRPKKRMPLSLMIVALLFLLSAILALVNFVEGLLFSSKISLEKPLAFLLFLGISYGLLRYSQVCRILAMILLCLSALLRGYILVHITTSAQGSFPWKFFEIEAMIPKPVVVALYALDLLLVLWVLYVLIRPRTRDLFRAKADPQPMSAKS